jgi:hypothetical protein
MRVEEYADHAAENRALGRTDFNAVKLRDGQHRNPSFKRTADRAAAGPALPRL